MVPLGVLGLCLLAACTQAARPIAEPSSVLRSDDAFAVRRFVWVSATCSDGSIDLASRGFERAVEVALAKDGYLMTFETAVATEGCSSTAVWHAARLEQGYRLAPDAWVTTPADRVCGHQEQETVSGELWFEGDRLSIVTQRSPWCRGFDARFVYQRVGLRGHSPSQVVARYVAHFERGDALALASLFAEAGAVVEGLSATGDGRAARHEGRAAIQAYFQRVFGGARWHAVRLVGLERAEHASVLYADLEYMDSELAQPLPVRASFVIAGGEVLECELQLAGDPAPLAQAATTGEP